MRHGNTYANTSAQQQPQRVVDRQQQQDSGSNDYQPSRTHWHASQQMGDPGASNEPAFEHEEPAVRPRSGSRGR